MIEAKDKDKQKSQPANWAPPADPDRRSNEEIRKDIRIFAEKNPRRGALHDMDPGRAHDKHVLEKFRAREELLPPEQSGPVSELPELGYCRVHPLTRTSWRCADCGREFCEACVTPLPHLLSHLHRAAVCPECKGRCYDFRLQEALAAEDVARIEQQRKSEKLRIAAFSILVLLFLLSPGSFFYMAVVVSALWFGPLREVDLGYKLGSLMVSAALLNPLLTLRMDQLGLFAGPAIYLKFLFIALLNLGGFYLLDRLATVLGGVFTGAPSVDDRPDLKRWFAVGAAVVVIAVVVALSAS